MLGGGERVAVADAGRPHVIIVGVDSLRKELVRRGDALTFAPNIRLFQRAATGFPDAITPLGRTFASWATILSGRHPVRSGARDALMPASALNVWPTLADRLRDAGYATTYATDDVRYSNIDQSFGFDQIVGPKMGAADFLVGRVADLPLSNLLVNTRVGAWLLPNVYGNRAVAQLYRPGTFVDWLNRSVDFSRPTFLAVHLTLPHWPYYWADTLPSENIPGLVRAEQYLKAVTAADRQFGQIMQNLRERGVLNNAIVIVLSDHGEALGLPQDEVVAHEAAQRLFGSTLIAGHGTSVFSPSQYQVLLQIRRSGGMRVEGHPSTAPASLEDIAPTVLAMIGLPVDPHEFDGMSLARALTEADTPELRARVRFMETGLTTSSLASGNMAEAANLREGTEFFGVDRASGRVVLNARRLPDLIARKQRAALGNEWMLAAFPQPGTSRQRYVLIRRSGGAPEILTDEPDVSKRSTVRRPVAGVAATVRRRSSPRGGMIAGAGYSMPSFLIR